MEDVIVGKKWWNISDEDGMLLTETGAFYYLQCQDSLIGTWIIEGDLIKLRYYDNSIEYTQLIAEVTSYTNTELKIKAQTNDNNLQANYILTTEFTETFGCTDGTAYNYNPLAHCDDGSCNFCLPSECTYVPDDNFEQYLIDSGYDDELDDYVYTANINTVIALDISGDLDVADLTGIESFIALTTLTCSYNDLTSLDVSQNTALTFLSCAGNELTSLDVSQNTALTYLNCNYNDLTSLDVSNNTLLEELQCGSGGHSHSNKLTSIDVSANTALTRLVIDRNQLTSLDVSQNTALTALWCYNNQLTNLDVSYNTALNFLYCRDNQLTTLDLSNNTDLVRLYCNSNNLINLDVRNGNNTNITLDCTNNPQLYCIDVDDVQYSDNNWFEVDSQSFFSEDCGVK
jgi:hypothetical protein